jgi:predicted transcriptional regulator
MPRGIPRDQEETDKIIVEGLRAGEPRPQIAAKVGITRQGVEHRMGQLLQRGVLGRTVKGRWYVRDDGSRWYEVTTTERVWATSLERAMHRAGVRTTPQPDRLDAGPVRAHARSVTGPEEELELP